MESALLFDDYLLPGVKSASLVFDDYLLSGVESVSMVFTHAPHVPLSVSSGHDHYAQVRITAAKVDAEPEGDQELRVRACAFLCGSNTESPDPEVPENKIRWGRVDGRGSSCWYCERVWAARIAHSQPNRCKPTYQEKLGKNMAVHTAFQQFRKEFLDDRKAGCKYARTDKRSGGSWTYCRSRHA